MLAVCGASTFAALACEDEQVRAAFREHPRFSRPLSTAMYALLLLSSAIFAITAVESGFEGSRQGGLASVGAGPFLAATALFLCLSYATLVRTKENLLVRFVPGLAVLLVANTLLGLGDSLGHQEQGQAWAVFAFYSEVYGEAFSWIILMYTLRTVKAEPARVSGVFLATESMAELALRGVHDQSGGTGLTMAVIGTVVTLIVLVWALYQLYETRGVAPSCETCPYRLRAAGGAEGSPDSQGVGRAACAPTSPKAHVAGVDSGSLRQIAVSHGLSPRETDVFLLLSQGYSRKYICDELFIADGTASTHIGRIYEKLGVHSKQELLSVVHRNGETS